MLRAQGFELVGHHFFSLDTPVFSMDQLGEVPFPVAVVRKFAETDAPARPHSGSRTGTDIKWLLLKDSWGTSRGGIDTVYRVATAGGMKPATCKGQKPNFEVKYAAQCKYHSHLPKDPISKIDVDWIFGRKDPVER